MIFDQKEFIGYTCEKCPIYHSCTTECSHFKNYVSLQSQREREENLNDFLKNVHLVERFS